MTFRRLCIAVVVSCIGTTLLCSEAAAQAPPVEEARGRELFENGALLYEEGRYEDAIFAWEEGYRLTGRGGFLYNIANAQERLGRYADAIDTLGRYRALARADEREVLDRRIRNLEARVAEAPPVPEPAPVPVPAPAPLPVPAPEPLPEPERGGAGRVVAGGALIAAGVVGLAVGTAFGLRSQAAGRQASSVCVDGATGLLCPDSAGAALQANRRSALVADIGLVGGVLAGAGGAVVLLTGGGGASDAAGPLVVVGGRF